MKTSIYNYNDPILFLLDYLEERKTLDTKFSMRSWSKEMELKTHTLLVMILNGTRKLRTKHLEFLVKGLDLTNEERDYMELLIDLSHEKESKRRQRLLSSLAALHPGDDFSSSEFDKFEYISDWVYMAILTMPHLKSFRGTEDEIFSKLGHKVSREKIRSCLTRLLNLKLIFWDENDYLKATFHKVKTKNDIRSDAVREYHKKVCELAAQAVEELPLEEREFQSFTIAIDNKKLPLAKKMIRDFRSQFSKAMSGDGDHIHNMNIQLFKITK